MLKKPNNSTFSAKHTYIHKTNTFFLLFFLCTFPWLQNLNQTSAPKYWPKFKFKISTELKLQNLDQTLFSKSEHKFSIKNMTNLTPQYLDQTLAFQSLSNYCQKFLIVKFRNSNNINKFWVVIFTSQGHINQVSLTLSSEWVSQFKLMSDKGRRWCDSCPCPMKGVQNALQWVFKCSKQSQLQIWFRSLLFGK